MGRKRRDRGRWEPEVGDPPTPRELQVLRQMAEGRHDPEIAISLGISINTVRIYARNLFRKLGVTNRAQAAVVGVQRDLIRGVNQNVPGTTTHQR